MQFANTVVVFEVDIDGADIDNFLTTVFVGGDCCWITMIGCAGIGAVF